ncbi:MAG: ATP-grasp domain-containing protein [Acidobacteriaceae bacterium]|nr:ATP-grasp domain-containing protein [Acidobacteriaceae bacterium]
MLIARDESGADRLALLITGVGAPGTRGTIYALRQNCERRPVRIIGVDVKPEIAGRYLVESFYTVPNPECPAYIDELASICAREGVEIILPQTSREVNVLSKYKHILAQKGVGTMVSDWPAIEIANNKWRLMQNFEKLGLPIPAYFLARSERELTDAAVALGYPGQPVVVKPPLSNGMRGVRILKEEAWSVERFLTEKPSGFEICLNDLLKILRRGEAWPELLVTEYLPGPEYSVDAFVGTDTQVAIPRLRRSIRSGITFESELDFREDLRAYTIRAARHIGLRYAIGFQFKVDRVGVPKLLECNPRIQGTMVASVFSGANVIWLAVRELRGDCPRDAPIHVKQGLFLRFWGGIGISGGYCEEI